MSLRFAPGRGAGRRAGAAPLLALLLAAGAPAEPPRAEPRLRALVGSWQTELVDPGDTLLDIAYEHRLGFESVARLNRDIDEWIPEPGTVIRLPTRYVLPDADEEGLVLNVPEMRLYDFTSGGEPRVYAVAVGDAGDPTPVREFRIGAKRVHPVWNVPDAIRAEKPHLPPRVPPGPGNPLGDRWMTLGSSSYGIHGTNIRWSIGRTATHGCVRLYEDEMRELYDRVAPGTRVQIVYQPFKWGVEDGRIHLEVHPDIYSREDAPLWASLATPRALGLLGAIDRERLWTALDAVLGIPVEVGALPPAATEPTSRRPS